MSLLTPFIFLLSISYIMSWYSRCDEAGRCTISETKDSEQIYLVPGYLPLFPEGNIIPIASSNTNSSSFSVDAIHGFPNYGKLPGYHQFECGGGLSECAFSCCKGGYCAETFHSCRRKSDTVELIYIITGSVFVAFIILYWVMYFVLGCKYNKYIVKTQKNLQQYGTVAKENQENPINHTIEEQSRDEVDEPGMRTHGSIHEGESDNGKNKEVDDEEEKRKKLTNVANRLAKLKENEVNIESTPPIQEEEDHKEVPVAQYQKPNQSNVNQYNKEFINQYNEQYNNQGEISISSNNQGRTIDKPNDNNKNVSSISDNFDEVNLEDL